VNATHYEEHRAALTALRSAATRLDAATAAACAAVEAQASELALALTEELVGHTLLTEGDVDVVRRAVRMLPDGERARVRMHPSVATSQAASELSDLGVTVVADPSVARDDSLVELDDRLVSIDLSAALLRLREVLG
ncbi:MAG: FliH/SctL family protein, partial [Actinomycetota bacterium]|nr:FliH/SctL family protein [Actinomycetota bacterium]